MQSNTSLDRAKEVVKRKIAARIRSEVIPKAQEMKIKSAAPLGLDAVAKVLKSVVPPKRMLSDAAKVGIGGAAVGVPAVAWYAGQAPADPEAIDPVTRKAKVTNLDKIVGDLSVRHALWKAKHYPDVEVSSGLHRVAIPKTRLKKDILKYIDFLPTPIAVPERGQKGLMTWRQFDTAAHIHDHGDDWMLHQDKWPALNMILKNPRSKLSFTEKLKEGLSHIGLEGIQGYTSYVKNLIGGPPTIKEIHEAKKNPKKYPEVIQWLKEREADELAELAEQKAASSYEELKVKIGPAELIVEVADTPDKRERGLGGREKIAEDRGMLFSPAGSYWMKGCNFDLDLLYINKEAEVCDIQTMSASDDQKVYEPRTVDEPILAIEAPAGWCRRNGVKIGHKLT